MQKSLYHVIAAKLVWLTVNCTETLIVDCIRHVDKIESIDMGRKGIHNEGARVIIERLDGRIKTDLETSRRIFTLIYALTYER